MHGALSGDPAGSRSITHPYVLGIFHTDLSTKVCYLITTTSICDGDKGPWVARSWIVTFASGGCLHRPPFASSQCIQRLTSYLSRLTFMIGSLSSRGWPIRVHRSFTHTQGQTNSSRAFDLVCTDFPMLDGDVEEWLHCICLTVTASAER